ncbi:MAG: chlorosome envelope protein B [Chlorobiaceae bacterium]|nr:chlorosome envelope protein B [Chlorobiaceae bacterium]
MAQETTSNVAQSLNDLMGAVGKIGQVQVEVLTSVLNSAASAIEPVSKTAVELIGNVANAATQAVQGVASAIAPKK